MQVEADLGFDGVVDREVGARDLGYLTQQIVQVRLHGRDGGIPYGIALAGGALCVYPHTAWFAGLPV